MDSEYYEALRTSPDAARRVGWRHSIEQAYRFEVVLDLVAHQPGRVLDVGCGTGALRACLPDDVKWTGVEREAEFVDARGDWLVSDYRELTAGELPSDLTSIVAVGALTGTDPIDGVRAIIRLARASGCPFAITITDSAALAEHRPGLSVEPHLGTLSESEAAAALQDAEGWATRVEAISVTDHALFGWPDEPPPAFRTRSERFDATLDGAMGPFTPERAAWLAVELELYGRATELLSESNPQDPFVELIRERIELSEERGPTRVRADRDQPG